LSRLDQAVRSVPADPSTADQEPTDTGVDTAANPQPEGQKGDEGSDPDQKSGRTIENVRGETLRKMKQYQDEISAELQALREELKQGYGVPTQQTAPASQPQTLDDMSVQQLETMRDQVPEDQRPAFDQYLLERKVSERVDNKLNEFQTRTQNQHAEQQYNETALDRWPALRDKTSALYRATDRILGEMGEHAKSPRAVLDAANEAGLELGLAPSTGVTRRTREPGRVAPGHRTASPPSREPEVDQAQQAQIIAGLQDAMPGREFSKEALKRIAERDAIYRENLQHHVRG